MQIMQMMMITMDCVRTGPHPQRTGEPADPVHCNALNIFPCARFFH